MADFGSNSPTFSRAFTGDTMNLEEPSLQPNLHDKIYRNRRSRSVPFSKDVGNFTTSKINYGEGLKALSIERLDKISSHLWLAGQPQADLNKKAPLHQLKAQGFEFVVYEQADASAMEEPWFT